MKWATYTGLFFLALSLALNLVIASHLLSKPNVQLNTPPNLKSTNFNDVEIEKAKIYVASPIECLKEFRAKDYPLSNSFLTDANVSTWASLATSDILSLSYHNHKKRFAIISEYFTDQGWQSFVRANEKSGLIETMEIEQQSFTAIAATVPIVTQRGVEKGRYQWRVRVPINLVRRSKSKATQTDMPVVLTIVRTNDQKYPFGIAIDKWDAFK